MRLTSIQGQMGLLFGAFFLMVAVSSGATLWALEAQKQDALLINLAGRQRMLTQQMMRLTLEIEKEGKEGHESTLQESMDAFEITLLALQQGGEVPYVSGETVSLTPMNDAIVQAQLAQVGLTWESMRASLRTLLQSEVGSLAFDEAVQSVERLSTDLVQQCDAVVRRYEAISRQKITRLRAVQFAFFIGALTLLAAGAWVTRRAVIQPLIMFGKVAARVGSGDLLTPVEMDGPNEVNHLAQALEFMRQQLVQSQEQLLAWTVELEQRVNQRTQELEALHQVSREIISHLDLNSVFTLVTKKARELLKADVAFLCLLDETGQFLNLHATSGPREAVACLKTSVQENLPSRVLTGPCALPCAAEGCLGVCEIIAADFRISHLAAPLRLGERPIGALCVGSSKSDSFSEEGVGLLTKLANSAAIALENARLYARAERLGTLEERQRIAAEMHDGLAQTLSYLRMAFRQARLELDQGQIERAWNTLSLIQRGLDQADREVRSAIESLQEETPLRYTLQEQLATLADEFSAQGPKVEWSAALNVPLILPSRDAEQVLRVVREALLNAQRHSQAERIRVSLEQNDGTLVVTIEDNGKGFDANLLKIEDGRQHFGLHIMRARAARLGGRVEVLSKPGEGTRVILKWPVPPLLQKNG